MYLFTHLLAGIILGVLLAVLFRDLRLVPACALGSVLPDLIDKPVGLLLFVNSIGSGRIYAHTLLFMVLILLAGCIVYIRYPRTGPLFIAVGIGVLSHQLLDAMWLEPKNWFWPALGLFKGHSRPDFFLYEFWKEITNPTEWLAGSIILAFIALAFLPQYRMKYFSRPVSSKQKWPIGLLILMIAAIVLLVITIFFESGWSQ
jgi:membrane-bound metal-dependent hydrolase YbcI (DUF457 family)